MTCRKTPSHYFRTIVFPNARGSPSFRPVGFLSDFFTPIDNEDLSGGLPRPSFSSENRVAPLSGTFCDVLFRNFSPVTSRRVLLLYEEYPPRVVPHPLRLWSPRTGAVRLPSFRGPYSFETNRQSAHAEPFLPLNERPRRFPPGRFSPPLCHHFSTGVDL